MIRKRKIVWLIGILVIAALLASILYEPYSQAEVARNLELAKSCDKNAISYLGDYYEKEDKLEQLHQLLKLEESCKKH